MIVDSCSGGIPFRSAREHVMACSTKWRTLESLSTSTTRVISVDPNSTSYFYLTDNFYLSVKERTRNAMKLSYRKFSGSCLTGNEMPVEQEGSREHLGHVLLDAVDLYQDLLVVLQRRSITDEPLM